MLARGSSKQNVSWTCIWISLWKSIFRTGSCSLLFLVHLIVFPALGHLVFTYYSADKILQQQWLLCIVGWHMLLFFFKRVDACQVLNGISGGHQSTQEMQPPSSKLPSEKITQKGGLIFGHHFPCGICYLAGFFLSRTQVLILGA